MLDFVPEKFLKEGYRENEMAGAYKLKTHKYVSKPNFKVHCSVMDSIKAHPFLNFFMQVLTAVFAVLMFCLLLTCCKYRSV